MTHDIFFLSPFLFKESALWADSFYKSKCPSVCPSVPLSIRLLPFDVPLQCLFAPSSQSRISITFRDSELFGKSKEKKWSQIGKLSQINKRKIPAHFFFFLANFALLSSIFLVLMLISIFGSDILCLQYAVLLVCFCLFHPEIQCFPYAYARVL